MMRLTFVFAMFGALAACGDRIENTAPPLGKTIMKSVYQTEGYRPAPIQILAPARSELRTFNLRPCGDTVCGTHRGRVSMTAEGAVITGAFRGTTLTLAPGGAGTLARGGRQTDIVWDFTD